MTTRAARKERRRQIGQRIWRGFWLLVLILVVALHAVGGWYFSGVLYQDALALDPFTPAEDVEVVEVEGDLITLRPLLGDDDELHRPGTYGFEHAGGYLHMGEIVFDDGDTVARRFTVLSGEPPVVGADGDVQSYAFPADPAVAGLDAATVTYESPLGPMEAVYTEGSRSDWVIHVHGKGGGLQEAYRLMRPLDEAGFHQLAIAYRNDDGQPADPSGIYQYGRTEWEDLAGAVEYAAAQGADRVVLVGYSTGAAIALSYLYKTTPELVRLAVLDSPNADMSATVDYGASQRELAFGIPLPPTLTGTAKFIAALRYGLNWQAIDYARRVGQLVVPTLILHGTDDMTVPIETSQEMAAERHELVTLVTVPGAGHVQSWNADPATYEQRVLDFISDNLS